MPSFQELRRTLELWQSFPALERLEAGSGWVALTFDDGPDRDSAAATAEALAAVAERALASGVRLVDVGSAVP